MRRYLNSIIPFVFVFLWSTGFIAAKYGLPFIEPFFMLFLRMVLTILFFILLYFLFRVKHLSMVQLSHQMVTGFLVHGCYLGGVFAAIKWGMPAGIAAIVVGVQPLLTAFIGHFFLDSPIVRRQWFGLTMGFIGVAIVLSSTANQASVAFGWPAIIASLAALFGISFGTLYQKRFGAGVNLIAGSLWQYISTCLFMAVLAWSFESRQVVWDLQLVLALGWLVFGLSVSAILLLMYMIREGETTKVASYFYLVPPVAAIEAWILFNERLTLLDIAAIALTVAGVYLVVKKSNVDGKVTT